MNKRVEHIRDTRNREDPSPNITEIDLGGMQDIEEIDTGSWTINKVKTVINRTKSGKAEGIDNVTLELLKADINTHLKDSLKYSTI